MPHDDDPHKAGDIEGDVYILPRHLALSTGVGDPGFTPLSDLGWEGPPAPTPLDVRRAAVRRPAVRPATSVPRWSTSSTAALPSPRR